MHKNCFPFPLRSESLIKDYVREYMKDSTTKPVYAPAIELPEYILNEINAEMLVYGLPKISNGMAFKRKFYLDHSYIKCHVDYSVHNDNMIHSSIVIPIDGCEDTCMYWYDGDYAVDVVVPDPTFPYTYPFMKVTWKSPGTLIEQVEISKEPMLCRVDMPHGATSRKDGTYRLVMTLRFKENLTVEEIIDRRTNFIKSSNEILKFQDFS